jgi:deoxyuridine 5'-triphosphate nucleotidohydrolase
MTFSVKLISPTAHLPSHATSHAAGWDLYADDSLTVPAGGRSLVSTGLKIVSQPEGTYARIAPRSGLAWRHGIQVGAGVVDSDYTGEVKVVLFNQDPSLPFEVRRGDRIAQLIFERVEIPLEVTEESDIPDTERGDGGFGSTGTS